MTRSDLLAWSAVGLLALVGGSLGIWLGKRLATADEPAPPPGVVIVAIGEPLPPLALPDLRTGADRQLAGPGRVRLVNYWASWCGPCREEMPALDAFAATQGDTGVEVVGIALDDAADARAFAHQVPVRFPLLVETPGLADSSVQLGNTRGLLPFSVLVGADGRLLKTHYGAFADATEVAAWAQ